MSSWASKTSKASPPAEKISEADFDQLLLTDVSFIHIGVISAPEAVGLEPLSGIAEKWVAVNSDHVPLTYFQQGQQMGTHTSNVKLVRGQLPKFSTSEKEHLKQVQAIIYLQAQEVESERDVFAYVLVRGDLFEHFIAQVTGDKPFNLHTCSFIMIAAYGEPGEIRTFMSQRYLFGEQSTHVVETYAEAAV